MKTMKQVIKYISLLILPLLLILHTASQCDDGYYDRKSESVHMINQSGETIYYCEKHYDKGEEPINNGFIFEHYRQFICLLKPMEKSVYEMIVKEDGYLSIAIFKESTLAKYSVSELVETNYCDKYYNYSYDELKAMNFTITYTGK